jgi:hypothetical protein
MFNGMYGIAGQNTEMPSTGQFPAGYPSGMEGQPTTEQSAYDPYSAASYYQAAAAAQYSSLRWEGPVLSYSFFCLSCNFYPARARDKEVAQHAA